MAVSALWAAPSGVRAGRDRLHRRAGLRRAGVGRVLLVDLPVPLLVSGLAAHDLLYNQAHVGAWLLAAVTIWPLLLRRRFPLLVFSVSLAGFVGILATASPSFAGFALLAGLYTVAAQRALPVALTAVAALEAAVVVAAWQAAPSGSVDDAVLVLSAMAVAALFLGTTMRGQRRYLRTLELRAAQLEREREQEAQIAATAERTRIAREMHDIVAHSLSVVTALAEGAATQVQTDPGGAQVTMQQVARTSRDASREMRRLVEVLRTEEPGSRTPQPTLTDLPALVADLRSTGLQVRLELVAGELDGLDLTVQATVFRVVQEALTNVLKHADRPTRVDVRVRLEEHGVVLSVVDDGKPRDRATSTGRGIVGMHERINLHGGLLRAGADSLGGWAVRGRIPVEGW